MAPELKKWLHAQPSKRDWIKIARKGGVVPILAIVNFNLYRRFMTMGLEYLPYIDAMKFVKG